MCGTLFGVQQQFLSKEKSLSDITREALGCLIEKGLLKGKMTCEKEQKSQSNLEITQLGQATYKGERVFFIFMVLFFTIIFKIWPFFLHSHLKLSSNLLSPF